MAAPAQPNNMDEILSSIRSSMEEETAKSAAGEAGAGDVLMLDQELSDDEILALTEHELGEIDEVSEKAPDEGLIDLAAFTASGNVTGATAPVATSDDVLGANLPAEPMPMPAAPAPVVATAMAMPAPDETLASEELDRIMDQIKQDQATPHADKVDALLADVPPPVAAAAPIALQPVAPGMRMELPAINGADGLQVALPSAVLAEALRPLITSWLSENLPGVVERLVQAEIAKLANQ